MSQLKNPPLVEVIFELRWHLRNQPAPPGVSPGETLNPNQLTLVAPDRVQDLLLGLLYEKLRSDYPFHEPLPTTMLPAMVARHVVQHRFRTDANTWPLIQIGPGILTVNDTRAKEYDWTEFSKRVIKAVTALYEVHPNRTEIDIDLVQLQYIDAEPLPNDANAIDFARAKLHVGIDLPSNLFSPNGHADPTKGKLRLALAYPCASPKGQVEFRVSDATHNGAPAIGWQTLVSSSGKDVPVLPDSLEGWLNSAHKLTHDWFFKLIDGELVGKYAQ